MPTMAAMMNRRRLCSAGDRTRAGFVSGSNSSTARGIGFCYDRHIHNLVLGALSPDPVAISEELAGQLI